MTQVVKLKRSAVQNKVPTTADLALGELAINTFDGKLFFKKNNGTESITSVANSSELNLKQDTLVSGSNIKTINGNSILGSGDIVISGGGGNMAYPSAGVAISTGSSWGASLTAPTSSIVGISDIQTLSNKTLDNPNLSSISDATSSSVGSYPLIDLDGYIKKDFKIKSVYPTSISVFGEEVSGKEWVGYTPYNLDFQLLTFNNGTAALGTMGSLASLFAHNVSIRYPSTQRVFAGGSGMLSFSSEGKVLLQTAASGLAGTNITWIDVLKSDATGNCAFGATNPSAGYRITIDGKLKISNALEISQGGTGAITATDALINLGAQAELVSGDNIKTINNNSILGGGNLDLPGMIYPSMGVPVSTGTAWGTSLTAPTTAIVGVADSQSLLNKRLVSSVIEYGYTETTSSITGLTPAISPTNSSIQTWVLTGNSTPTAGTWASGQSVTLMIDDGTAYSIVWTSMAVTWKTDNGSAPTLNTTGYTVIQLWKVGTVIYGARVGNA